MSSEEQIAFQADCELLNARWDLDSGRTVEFRISGDAYDRMHPFKRFTKKRNGRVGTRFMAAVGVIPTGELQYKGEAMLAAWGDSSFSGQNFRLWLDDEADRHPFAGCQARRASQPGDQFFVVLVELTDDERIASQEKSRRKSTLSSQAHLMVTSPMFIRYLTEQVSAPKIPWTPSTAKAYVKQLINIESLSMLDRDPDAKQRFERQVRKPYARWNGQEP